MAIIPDNPVTYDTPTHFSDSTEEDTVSTKQDTFRSPGAPLEQFPTKNDYKCYLFLE